jgi:hypothetical protein
MGADPIIYCLEHVTDYDQFERLCHDLMVSQGWSNIEPLGGMKDRGRDAIHISRGNPDDVTIFAYSVREDWRKKLVEDAEKIRMHGHICSRLVFLNTASFTPSERDEAVSFIQKDYGWFLELYGLERLRVLLAAKHEGIIAKHPQIFSPPFFPVVGGVSLAASRDYLIIDHEEYDEALAVWLARRLTLEGYLVWCRSIAPIAGASLHRTVEALTKQRAFRFLAILSPQAVASPDVMARRATALAIASAVGCDLVIPIVAARFDDHGLDAQTRVLTPLHFDESWQTGLDKLLQYLHTANCPQREGGAQIARRSLIPADVITSTEEQLLSNRFSVPTVPKVIYRFISNKGMDTEVVLRIGLDWSFRQVDPKTFLSFHVPSEKVRQELAIKPAGGSLWPSVLEIDGISVRNLVPELIRKALTVACIRKGLLFCENQRLVYFPTALVKSNRLPFTKPDGSRSHVNTVGKRTFWRPGFSSEYHYHLAPSFSVQRVQGGALTVVTRIRVRLTDANGALLGRRTAISRRKHLCQDWWNDDWLHRILAIMQFLGDGKHILIGESSNDSIVINVQPHEWIVPIGIDENKLANATETRQELLTSRSDDDGDED